MLTDLHFLNIGEKWTPEDADTIERLATYATNKLLFEGKHEMVFDGWIKLLRDDDKATMELIFNWNKRLSTLWADLLYSEQPRFKVGEQESPEQKFLDKWLVRKNKLKNVLYETAIDVSRYGSGVIVGRFDGKRVVMEATPPDVWFPVVNPSNIKDILYHVIAWSYTTFEGNKKQRKLKADIHSKGNIETRVYNLKDGGFIDEMVEQYNTPTGVNEFLVFPIHNLITSDRATGIDDYKDIETIVQELEIRAGQIARILDKHADPAMYGTDNVAQWNPDTEKYELRLGGKYFPVGQGDVPPAYLVWDGQLTANFAEVDMLLKRLYEVSETSPACFGTLEQGLAESGSALRRLMLTALAKTSRLRSNADPVIHEMLITMSQFAVKQGQPEAVALDEDALHIEWQDGLPKDEKEMSEIETKNYVAGLTSLESSLRRLFGLEGQALEDEIARIQEEKQAGGMETFAGAGKGLERGTDPSNGMMDTFAGLDDAGKQAIYKQMQQMMQPQE